jgi:hypothetical protein
MKNFFLIVLAVFIYQSAYSQNNVGINTDNPDASAVLDVSSTQKGLLIPRMTLEQRGLIAAPAKGLLIFQIDGTQGFYFYNGTTWTTLNGIDGATGPAGPNGQTGATGPDGPTGPAGPGFANGSAAAQVYLTSGASPFAPQSPVSVSGDITINSSGSTTISNNAVTTAKLANNSVTTQKISATGTAGATTFLRGDGSWAVPSAGASSSGRFARRANDLQVGSSDYQDAVSINLEANKTYTIYSKVVLQRAGSVNVDMNCRVKFTSDDAICLSGGVYYTGAFKTGTNFSSTGGFDSDPLTGVTASAVVNSKFIVETVIQTVTAGTLTIQVNRRSSSTESYFIRSGTYITATPLSE